MPITVDGVSRIAGLATAVALGLLAGVAWPAGAAPARVDLGEGLTAVRDDARQILLEAAPAPAEGLLAFARRFCAGDEAAAATISAANGGARRLLAGVRYRIPFEHLRPEYQVRVARALFRQDRAQADGWSHEVGLAAVTGGEGLWQIAEWFTGEGTNYRAIREHNRLPDDAITPGQTVVIPAALLRPAFRSLLPPATAPYQLEHGRDEEGDVAVYRLQPGEALYSSVVVRFTGRVFAEDVNAMAADIAARSGIADVTDIPVGYEVRIPFEELLPEYLPPGHPRRREYEESLVASARYSNQVRATRLEGITVVLDAGHGGRDVGATMGGVWESLYVYDIVLRAKRLLETTTAARVVVTTRDGEDFRIHEQDILPFSKGHRVLTEPPYPIEDSRVGVNLRWYLANSVYRESLTRQVDAEKVIFISVHADSLHPSLRGAMAYIPGADGRPSTYAKSGAVYVARQEVKDGQSVRFSQEETVRSEGLSRDLARHVIAAFGEQGLAIHPFKPVREKIIRGGRRKGFVPAVLRYNKIPASMLLEVSNLANEEDRRLIQTRAFREKVASAVVQGILTYYDGAGRPRPAQVASGGA